MSSEANITVPDLSPRERAVLERIKVNAPAAMLLSGRLDRVLGWPVHFEVGLDAAVMDQAGPVGLSDLARSLARGGHRTTVHGPFWDLAPGAVDPYVLEVTRERFFQALELARLFSPEHVVFHANYDRNRYGDAPERWLAVSLDTWRLVAGRARELGLGVVLENVYERTPDELLPLLGGLADEGVGFCFDIGHANTFGQAPASAWLAVMAPYLAALHLHDNHGAGDAHLAIGRGGIDFPAFFRCLAQTGRQPRVTMEPHYEDQFWPSLQALAEFWPWPLP